MLIAKVRKDNRRRKITHPHGIDTSRVPVEDVGKSPGGSNHKLNMEARSKIANQPPPHHFLVDQIRSSRVVPLHEKGDNVPRANGIDRKHRKKAGSKTSIEFENNARRTTGMKVITKMDLQGVPNPLLFAESQLIGSRGFRQKRATNNILYKKRVFKRGSEVDKATRVIHEIRSASKNRLIITTYRADTGKPYAPIANGI